MKMKPTFTAAERRSIAETVERLNAFLDGKAEHVESLDGKPLTDGEKEMIRLHREHVENTKGWRKQWEFLADGEAALIKAIRGVKLEHVCNEGGSLLVYSRDNCPTFHVSHIAFHVSEGIEKRKAIFDALKQIQAEQEARNG